jgi:hypothetical protein
MSQKDLQIANILSDVTSHHTAEALSNRMTDLLRRDAVNFPEPQGDNLEKLYEFNLFWAEKALTRIHDLVSFGIVGDKTLKLLKSYYHFLYRAFELTYYLSGYKLHSFKEGDLAQTYVNDPRELFTIHEQWVGIARATLEPAINAIKTYPEHSEKSRTFIAKAQIISYSALQDMLVKVGRHKLRRDIDYGEINDLFMEATAYQLTTNELLDANPHVSPEIARIADRRLQSLKREMLQRFPQHEI